MIIDPYRFAVGLPAFNPADYGTVVAWYSDTGSDPSVWPDLSGNGNDAAQATMSKQPAIVTGAQNGRQVRRFDGIDDGFTHGLSQTTPCSIFVVAKRVAGGSDYQVLVAAIAPNAAFGANLSAVTSGSANWGEYINSWKPTAHSILDSWSVLGLSQAGISDTATTNGSAETLSDTSRYGGDSNDRRSIGGDPGFNDGFFSGDIAEIVICSAVSDRAGLEAALMSKWGITP